MECSVRLSSLGNFYHFINHVAGSSVKSESFDDNEVHFKLEVPCNKVKVFEADFFSQFGVSDEGQLK